MLDLKVDLASIRQAKELKAAMLQRLRLIDLEGAGLITLDSLLTICENYGIKMAPSDLNLIKDRYQRRGLSS